MKILIGNSQPIGSIGDQKKTNAIVVARIASPFEVADALSRGISALITLLSPVYLAFEATTPVCLSEL